MTTAATTLNPRRQAVLELLVSDYIRTAAPVASQQLARLHVLPVSPATIRNDVAELEEMGFIVRPHPSAGAVPSDRAYRFYVGRIRSRARPSKAIQDLVQRTISSAEADTDRWARAAAAVLSRTVRNVAIATTPRIFQTRMKQLQLVHLQDHQALVIVVMQEARLRQQMVTLGQPVTQEYLTALATRLNAALSGRTAAEIEQAWKEEPAHEPLSDQLVAEALRLMAMEDQAEHVRPYLEGLGHMLAQPEFLKGARAQRAVELLEDPDLIGSILAADGETKDISITIGEEHQHPGLQTFSVVLAQYGVPGAVSGLVCAIGPTRMDYGLVIASVRYLAQFLSSLHATLTEAGG